MPRLPRNRTTEDNPDFVPDSAPPAAPERKRKDPAIRAVTPIGFASFDVTLTDGSKLHLMAAGNGDKTNFNSEARDRFVEVLQRALEGPA